MAGVQAGRVDEEQVCVEGEARAGDHAHSH